MSYDDTIDIWSRIDAARVLLEAAETERHAKAQRGALALVLADARAEQRDTTAIEGEYAQAKAAHEYALAVLTEARDELDVMRHGSPGTSLLPLSA